MSKEKSKKQTEAKSSPHNPDDDQSLIAKGKGIWPLIISVFLVAIYIIVSTVMLFISYWSGRI
jgi:hypothetical protein